MSDRFNIAALMASWKGNQSLKAMIWRSASWTFVGFGAQSVLRLGSNLVLTRLLVPDVFGLMSLAMVFLTGLMLLSDLGTTASVVRSERGDDPVFLRTAWSVQAVRGVAIAVLTCIVAFPIAALYDQPELGPLLCFLSLSAICSGLASISIARANRQMTLGRLTGLEIGAQLAGVIVTIIAAWMLESVWALAFGAVLAAMLRAGFSHVVLPKFAHGIRFERQAMTEIITFGRWILLATLLGYIGGRGTQAVQGALVPVDVLGLIFIAATLAWMIGDIVGRILNMAIFPAYATIFRERPNDLAKTLTKTRTLILVAIMPLFVLLSAVAQPLIDFLYDPRYAQAGAYLTILALNSGMAVLPMPIMNALLAVGDSRGYAALTFCSALFRVTGIIAGFHLAGIEGMLMGGGIGTLGLYLVSVGLAARHKLAHFPLDTAALLGFATVYYILL